MANTKGWRCSVCGQRFAMKAHLARHASARHGVRPAAQTGGGQFDGIVGEMAAFRRDLVARRAQIDVQLAAMDRALVALSAGANRQTRGPVAARPAVAPKRRSARSAPGVARLAILRGLNERGPIMPTALAKFSGVKVATVSNTLSELHHAKSADRSDKGWTLTGAGKTELARRLSATKA